MLNTHKYWHFFSIQNVQKNYMMISPSVWIRDEKCKKVRLRMGVDSMDP